MADKTVTVEALQVHTAFGKAYKVGDVYEIDEAFADSIVVQGKAKRVMRSPAKSVVLETQKPA